jgi:flagellar L-ring protein precursor FlgH
MRRLALLLVLAAAACTPPPPLYRLPPPDLASAPLPPGNGSLWHSELGDNYAALDVRARFPGDLLTVVVEEASAGKKDATTDTSFASSISANVQDFFGITAAMVKLLPKMFSADPVVKAETARESKGDGETTRSGTLSARITATVVAVDTNGNLVVKGEKVVAVNGESQYIVLSGVVRPVDIRPDNSVLSSRLADARIDYYGQGTVGSKQRVPLVHTLFDYIWPF